MPVNSLCAEYLHKQAQWRLVRDAVEGEFAIKRGRVCYLPALSGQDAVDYDAYAARARWFDATCRTAEGLHGHIFAKDPVQIGTVSDRFKALLKNVDASGTNIDQFASNITWDAMQTGWGGILVDHIAVPSGTSVADMQNRAFVTWYAAESIVNWRYSVIQSVPVLSLVVLREDRTETNPNDEFTTITIECYRVLSFDEQGNYIQRIFEQNKQVPTRFTQMGDAIMPKIRGKPIPYIPFFTCPGETPEKSMLLGLAFENIGYYQKTADYENGLHYTGIPTPIVENMITPLDEETGKPKEVTLGCNFLFFHNDQNDKAVNVKYLEFSGAGLGQLLQALNACLDRMAKLGIQSIGAEKKGVETAEVAQIHRASENGVLGAFARNMGDKITQALRFMLKWNGIDETEADTWSYELNSNFNYAEINAQILAIMHTARQSNEIPRIVWYTALKQAGKLPENMTFEDFLVEIEKDLFNSPKQLDQLID